MCQLMQARDSRIRDLQADLKAKVDDLQSSHRLKDAVERAHRAERQVEELQQRLASAHKLSVPQDSVEAFNAAGTQEARCIPRGPASCARQRGIAKDPWTMWLLRSQGLVSAAVRTI